MNSNLLRVSCLLFLTIVSICVYGQSGRRQNKSAPPPPVPTPTPEPTATPTPPAEDNSVGFIVGVDRNSAYSYYPVTYYSAVLQGCADSLRRGSSARVEVSERDFDRGQAIKLAKTQTKTYVVFLQLGDGSINPSNSTSDRDLELEFVVFAPETAKVATGGRSYPNATRKGPIVVGPSSGRTTSTIYREQLLKHAGEEAGERILKSLHLNTVKGP